MFGNKAQVIITISLISCLCFSLACFHFLRLSFSWASSSSRLILASAALIPIPASADRTYSVSPSFLSLVSLTWFEFSSHFLANHYGPREGWNILIDPRVHFKEDVMFYIRISVGKMQERIFVFPKETDVLYQNRKWLLDQQKQSYSNHLICGLFYTVEAKVFLTSYSARC